MYDFQTVLKAIERENIGAALTKLASFARSTGLIDLENWANAELNGSFVEVGGPPEYRKVGVQWRDFANRIIPISIPDDNELSRLVHHLPMHIDVTRLESFETTGFDVQAASVAASLSKLIRDQWGNLINLRSAYVSPNEAQALLKRIRNEALHKLQAAVPSASAHTSVQTMPDFNWVIDAPLKEILEIRWREADSAVQARAYLACIILLGSLIEGALLYKVEQNPAVANRATTCPKEVDASGKTKPKVFSSWTLESLITVAHEVGWLRREVKDFASVLRLYRNLVHPNEQRKQSIYPTDTTCEVCFPVVRAALRDLSGA